MYFAHMPSLISFFVTQSQSHEEGVSFETLQDRDIARKRLVWSEVRLTPVSDRAIVVEVSGLVDTEGMRMRKLC